MENHFQCSVCSLMCELNTKLYLISPCHFACHFTVCYDSTTSVTAKYRALGWFTKNSGNFEASAAGRRRRRLYVFGSSIRAAVRASVRPSVIRVVVLCFRDISSIC